jgi:hypothetical protein
MTWFQAWLAWDNLQTEGAGELLFFDADHQTEKPQKRRGFLG